MPGLFHNIVHALFFSVLWSQDDDGQWAHILGVMFVYSKSDKIFLLDIEYLGQAIYLMLITVSCPFSLFSYFSITLGYRYRQICSLFVFGCWFNLPESKIRWQGWNKRGVGVLFKWREITKLLCSGSVSQCAYSHLDSIKCMTLLSASEAESGDS